MVTATLEKNTSLITGGCCAKASKERERRSSTDNEVDMLCCAVLAEQLSGSLRTVATRSHPGMLSDTYHIDFSLHIFYEGINRDLRIRTQ